MGRGRKPQDAATPRRRRGALLQAHLAPAHHCAVGVLPRRQVRDAHPRTPRARAARAALPRVSGATPGYRKPREGPSAKFSPELT